jgi:FkbM family methyltransferase
MPPQFLNRVASGARRGWRAVVPVSIRRRVRALLTPSRPRTAVPGPRRFELQLPRPDGEPLTSGHASLVIEAARHLHIAKVLHKGGLAGYEPETEALLLGLAELIRPSVVFDVGANIGPTALLLPAVLDIPVVAFEPASDIAAVLRHLVALNHLRCTVEETAVGDRDGTATLFISPTDTSTSLQAGFREPTAKTTVPVVSLDSYVRSSGAHPTLLKIDTETTEPAVLEGARELLSTRPWIVCEILPGWSDGQIDSLLRPLGYRGYRIGDSLPLLERDTTAGCASLEERNWLFAPEAPTATLWDAVARWRRAIDACGAPRDLAPAAAPG